MNNLNGKVKEMVTLLGFRENNMDLKIFIVITAVGVPALMIGLGWFQQMTGYALNNSDMIRAGNAWMVIGALIYVLEVILAAYIYFKSEG
jgi:uncharacterized membrane protein YidH (DUF202 family)